MPVDRKVREPLYKRHASIISRLEPPAPGGAERAGRGFHHPSANRRASRRLSVPYGMRPGWDTGVHTESPAAVRDGFDK